MVKKIILIATLYNPDPILIAANRLSPDRLILLISKDPPKEQTEAFELIKNSIGRVITVENVKIDTYDIVSITKRCVELIDDQNSTDDIYVNITGARKTQALGLMFAAYTRSDIVKGIAYNPEEDKKAIVWLPKLSFHLTTSQQKVLSLLLKEKNGSKNFSDLAKQVEISRAMFYRNIEDLRRKGYLSNEDLTVTDAGKIALM